ncbi:Vacuolar protein sorting-associated protein 8 [Ascosphaera pollenicola]|nr:Vacuolar protein sorting-associated protein 8 [Ascosphaera pollenicola]
MTKQPSVVVAGSVAIDLACDYAPLTKVAGTQPALQVSNPSVIKQSLGGVGHNVARAVNYVGTPTTLCSVVADDFGGRTILSELQRENIRTDGIIVMDPKSGDKRTAQYIAVNDTKKDLMVAMADMSILETEPEEIDFEGKWGSLFEQERPGWLVIDANWSSKAIAKWVSLAKRSKTNIAYEPVSAPKSARLFIKDKGSKVDDRLAIKSTDVIPNNAIDLANPNNFELASMWEAARTAGHLESEEWFKVIDSFNITAGAGTRQKMEHICGKEIVDQGVPQQSVQLLPYIPCIITKLGSRGALLTQIISSNDPRLTSPDHMKYILGRALIPREGVANVGGIYMRLFPPAESVDSKSIVSVNGVGDTLLGAIVAGLANHPNDKHKACLETIVPVAQKASVETLKSAAAISPRISQFAKELMIKN